MDKVNIKNRVKQMKWKELGIIIKMSDEYDLYFPDDVLWYDDDLIDFTVTFISYLKEIKLNQFDLGPIRIELFENNFLDKKFTISFIIDEYPEINIKKDVVRFDEKLNLLKGFATKYNYQNLVKKIDRYINGLNNIKWQ